MDFHEKDEAEQLAVLQADFADAIRLKEAGKLDKAEDGFRGVLAREPRLAEPRMELARILLDTDRLLDAETHAREALKQLDAGGQWVEDLSEEVVLGLCHGLLAEILRRRADEDDVIFGDPDGFKALLDESKHHFERAAALDPSDEYASYYAVFLGKPQPT